MHVRRAMLGRTPRIMPLLVLPALWVPMPILEPTLAFNVLLEHTLLLQLQAVLHVYLANILYRVSLVFIYLITLLSVSKPPRYLFIYLFNFLFLIFGVVVCLYVYNSVLLNSGSSVCSICPPGSYSTTGSR